MKVKAKTLAQLAAKPGGWPKPQVCRICLEPETFAKEHPRAAPASSLENGICVDRQACEKRAPTLFGP